MKIMVTGGAGYIGSVLSRKLIGNGHDVVIVDSCMFGEESLKDIVGSCEIFKEDIRDPQEKWFEGIDCICHLGGFSNDPMAAYNPEANMEINFHATSKVAEMAKKCGVRKFVFASSASLYDRGVHAHNNEIYSENSEINLNPEYYYSESKLKAEKFLEEIADDNFRVFCLRKGTVFGWSDRMRFDLVVNTMIKTAICEGRLKVFHGGIMWRPLVDVSDVADAYILCSEAHAVDQENSFVIYNIVQENYRILDLAYIIEDTLKEKGIQVDVQVEESNEQQRSYKMAGDKIREELNFRASVDVRTSVQEIVEQIRNRGLDDPAELNNPKYYNIEWMKLYQEDPEQGET
ncbi:MAG: NAD(P)-dependent oxidoreductase [bacterium]|nr:NAD(P)-dependent oxidoreductase [bacterium]